MNTALPKPRKPSVRQIEKRRAVEGAKLRVMMESYAQSHGATAGRLREFAFSTLIGPLEVSIHDDWIACRWDDVQRAVKHFGTGPVNMLNPYSGKWNFGCGEQLTAIELFTWWERAVNPLLMINPEHVGCTHSDP